MPEQQLFIEDLERQGFDRCRPGEDGYVRIGCSQCEALAINGVATHETGCPNWARAWRADLEEEPEPFERGITTFGEQEEEE